MEVREVLLKLRSNQNLTQDQMAERLHVTRQAVSRWETGETQPNTEMLKVRRVHQHVARRSAPTLLPMLRNASQRRFHDQP